MDQESKQDNLCQETNQGNTTISSNFITIVPEECSRSNRIYNIPQNSEYIDQYRLENSNTEEISGSQSALYSVSQHVAPVNTSYANLCQNSNAGDGNYTNNGEWERERTVSCSETTKDTSSEALSTDKQVTGNICIF